MVLSHYNYRGSSSGRFNIAIVLMFSNSEVAMYCVVCRSFVVEGREKNFRRKQLLTDVLVEG